MSLSNIDIKFFKLAVGLDNIGKETQVDIVARCPVCGDSRKNKHTKRLHLYIKGDVTQVNCFNGDCAAHNKTPYSFLRDFYPALLGQYKRENFGNTMERLANGETDVLKKFEKPKEEKKDPVLVQDLSTFFTPILDKPEALEYVRSRGFTYDPERYGEWFYGHQDLKIGDILYKTSNSLVIPLYYKDQMYGFYSRNIVEKVFYTYMHDTNIGFKIWNWFNIDKNQPVFIYEGIFDALAGGFPNSIASMGAKIPDERLKELKHPVFVLDNDKTGFVNSINYAKQGHSVYVQPDTYPEKDMNSLMQEHPDINCVDLIQENIFSGISAEVRLKTKL